MPEQTKPPIETRRIYSADLEVEHGGATYYPHAAEWVEFRGRIPFGLYLSITELAGSREGLVRLAGVIQAWSWTDDAGTPYESPPTPETLMLLPKEELAWLIQHVEAEGESLGNGSTPST